VPLFCAFRLTIKFQLIDFVFCIYWFIFIATDIIMVKKIDACVVPGKYIVSLVKNILIILKVQSYLAGPKSFLVCNLKKKTRITVLILKNKNFDLKILPQISFIINGFDWF